MTKEEFAKLLNGRMYREEITPDEIKLAKENGLLVIYGASDDLAEVRGAYDTEIGCWEGGKLLELHEKFNLAIAAVWDSPSLDCSWSYNTLVPHATFDIMDEDGLYCRGVVIDIKDRLAPKHSNNKVGDWHKGNNDGELICSECGRVVTTRENYCPSCGLKMLSM